MRKDNVIGLKIAYYRNLTDLHKKNQLIKSASPAKLFRVTIDELFGNTSGKEIVYSFIGNVPWNDDGKLRIAVYSGRKLMEQSEYICSEGINLINLQFCGHGEQYNVNGICKVNCFKADKE